MCNKGEPCRLADMKKIGCSDICILPMCKTNARDTVLIIHRPFYTHTFLALQTGD